MGPAFRIGHVSLPPASVRRESLPVLRDRFFATAVFQPRSITVGGRRSDPHLPQPNQDEEIALRNLRMTRMTLPTSLAIGALAFGAPLAAAIPGFPELPNNPLGQNVNADFRCFSVNAGENHTLSGMACTTPTGSQTVGAMDKQFTLATINGNWSCRHGNVTSAIQGMDTPASLPVNVQGSDCTHVVADQQAQQGNQQDSHNHQGRLHGSDQSSHHQHSASNTDARDDQNSVVSDQNQQDQQSQNGSSSRHDNQQQNQSGHSSSDSMQHGNRGGAVDQQQSSQDQQNSSSDAHQGSGTSAQHRSTSRDMNQQDQQQHSSNDQHQDSPS